MPRPPGGDAVFLHRGALAEATLRNGQHRLAGLGQGGAHHIVALPQADAPDAHGRAAHGPDVGLVEADGLAVVGGDEDPVAAVGLQHVDEPVALVQGQGPDAVVAEVLQGRHLQALHGAVAGGHEQEQPVVAGFPEVQHGLDPLAGLHLQIFTMLVPLAALPLSGMR